MDGHLQYLLNRYTDVFKDIKDLETNKQLEAMVQDLPYLMFGDAYQRVASVYYLLASHESWRINGGVVIQKTPTHQQIADLLNLTRETTTLMILKLKKTGWIHQTRRDVAINDIAAFKEYFNDFYSNKY